MINNIKTLVILAAGIGTRYGYGIKQLESVGPNGELIIDYSIHDAIAAGFQKIIFIIRKNIEKDFRFIIGDRIKNVCEQLGVEVAYAYQEIDDIPISIPADRIKPWGTGHAVLCCDGLIDGSFTVINADDYYGKKCFEQAAAFLDTGAYGLVGYTLKNTLSDNGCVTRGICNIEKGRLIGIDETRGIIKTNNGAEAAGRELDMDSVVSMNFWCYPHSFMEVLKKGFPIFLENMEDPLNDEYLLPDIADKMIKEGTDFTVLPTIDNWFGLTFKGDKIDVIRSFKTLYQQGVYNQDLYSDLIQ